METDAGGRAAEVFLVSRESLSTLSDWLDGLSDDGLLDDDWLERFDSWFENGLMWDDERKRYLDGIRDGSVGVGDRAALAELLEERDVRRDEALKDHVDRRFGALRYDLRTKFSRDEFLFGKISELLPRPRREETEVALRVRVRRWDKLPGKAQRFATTAHYLWHDSPLEEFEAVESALAALRASIESTLRHVLGITGRAEMKEMIEGLENQAPDERTLIDNVRRLVALGNRALHQDLPSFARDLDEAWSIALGDDTSPGCLDLLAGHVQQRRSSRR